MNSRIKEILKEIEGLNEKVDLLKEELISILKKDMGKVVLIDMNTVDKDIINELGS